MTDEYYDIDFQQKHPTVKGYWVQADKFTEMYRKATALDKIRAEIEEHTDGNNHCDEYLDGYNDGMKDALEIIDKYTKGAEK